MLDLKTNNNQTEKTVINLKEITDLLNVRHDKAMVKVEALAEEPSFGLLVKKSIFNLNNLEIKTYALTEKQAELVRAVLVHKAKSNKSNVLYLITDGTYTKIGIATNNATSRLKQCQTGNPMKLWIDFEIELVEARESESLLHKTYAEKRLQGEWFKLTKEDITEIKTSIINKEVK